MASATLAGSSSARPHESDDHFSAVPEIPTEYRIEWDPSEVRAHCEKYDSKDYLALKPDRLQWSPFLVTVFGVDPVSVPPPLIPSSPLLAAPPFSKMKDWNAEAGPSGERPNGANGLSKDKPANGDAGRSFDGARLVNGTTISNGAHYSPELELEMDPAPYSGDEDEDSPMRDLRPEEGAASYVDRASDDSAYSEEEGDDEGGE